jgi:hypothetical protein
MGLVSVVTDIIPFGLGLAALLILLIADGACGGFPPLRRVIFLFLFLVLFDFAI